MRINLLSKSLFVIITAFLVLVSSFKAPDRPMEKPELIYVFDPLCGWCYGFSPVSLKLKERFGDTLTYSVYTGGLVLGDRVGTVKENFGFVFDTYKRIEELSGTMFGEGFKTNILGKADTYVFNSAPPGKAFVIMKEMLPDSALEIAHAIQHGIYDDGKDLNQPGMYLEIADRFGLDTGMFSIRYNDTAYDSLLYNDFQMGQYYQAQGYPHVLLRKGEQYYLLTRGYQGYENLERIIEGILAEKE